MNKCFRSLPISCTLFIIYCQEKEQANPQILSRAASFHRGSNLLPPSFTPFVSANPVSLYLNDATITFCHADVSTPFFSTLNTSDELGIDVLTYSYGLSFIYYPMQDWGSVMITPKQIIFKHSSDFLHHTTSITLFHFSDSPSVNDSLANQ